MEKILAKIIEQIIKNMSQDLRKDLEELIRKWEVKAKVSVNPWDDLVILIVKVAMGIG